MTCALSHELPPASSDEWVVRDVEDEARQSRRLEVGLDTAGERRPEREHFRLPAGILEG